MSKLSILGGQQIREIPFQNRVSMGENEKNSVVDKNLKVHKIENLYVAGSSVFPSCGYKNPTFTYGYQAFGPKYLQK